MEVDTSKANSSTLEQKTVLKCLHKSDFINPDPERYEQIKNFVDDKLMDNGGETILQINSTENGQKEPSDDEIAKSIETIDKICKDLDCGFSKLTNSSFLIRKNVEQDDFNEIRISVLGNVDAGKSTLLSVLTHADTLDNGRGAARSKLFRHKHEIESGRTSSVGNVILGFDSQGKIVNQPSSHGNVLNWLNVCEKSSKLISFIDLCGHERYLKTSIYGMTGLVPNYCQIIIGANAGIIGSTKEHLGLALALKVPLYIVITKLDLAPKNVFEKNLETVQKVLKSTGCRKQPLLVQTKEDVILAANNFSTSKLCPIFLTSCVTGQNLDLLKMFLNLLSPKHEDLDKEPVEFQIDENYSVAVGTVVSGLLLKGVIRANDTLYLGPNKLNKFEQVVIKSIHRKRMPVNEVRSGQSASFALKKVKRNDIRKGMVLLSTSLEPKAYLEFYAEILILHHPTTISKGYQAMIHCGSIRQTATIVSIMNQDCLRTGDKAKVHLKFIKNPEYIRINQSLIFREGRTKAIGRILSVVESSAGASVSLNKKKLKCQHNETNENADLNNKVDSRNKNRTK